MAHALELSESIFSFTTACSSSFSVPYGRAVFQVFAAGANTALIDAIIQAMILQKGEQLNLLLDR